MLNNNIILYADKKEEDNIIIKNMFQRNMKINIGWTDRDIDNDFKLIEKLVKDEKINQLIFSGFELGWNKLVTAIKEKYNEVKIKVICNTNDSLLYYEYERNNFFCLLNLSKKGIIDDIAFFRKGQYEVYNSLGYKCSYLLENYKLVDSYNRENQADEIIQIGFYPLNYTWDKNIFNQLCIPKFIENSNLNYNSIDNRMDDFLKTMKINHKPCKIESIDENSIAKFVIKNNVIVNTSFTDYVHPLFFISMELGVPCLIGNNSDLFSKDDKLYSYVVSSAEDNAIVNASMIKKILKDKDRVIQLYNEWKEGHNRKSIKSVEEFINK